MDLISGRKVLYLLLRSINCNVIDGINLFRAKNIDMDFSLNNNERARSMIRNKSIDDGI